MSTRSTVAFVGLVAVTMTLVVACRHPSSDAFQPSGAAALDGDTFRWSGQRYRLSGIDAPELPGHCKGYRLAHASCAPGDPYAARSALQYYLNMGVTCRDLGPDYYRRRLVDCNTADDDGGHDVGQLLMAEGYAIRYIYHGSHHS